MKIFFITCAVIHLIPIFILVRNLVNQEMTDLVAFNTTVVIGYEIASGIFFVWKALSLKGDKKP